MKKLFKLFTCLGLLAISQQANAAGFALIEQSASSMGTAYSGTAATAEDATTVWFNPAGMTRFCNQQIVVGGQGVYPNAHFHNDNSRLSPGLGGAPLTGGNGGNGGVKALVPSNYYVRPLGCGWAFGLGINAPFGLATHYESDWVGRYYARYSKILTININPSIAYQICDNLSIGAGFSAQYMRATLTNSVDFGSILFAVTQGQLGVRQGQDGRAKLKGDSWGFGGNIGILWDLDCYCTSIGLHYRSEIKQELKGHVRYDNVPSLLTGTFSDTHIKANATLPQSLTLSAVHHINCCWDVMGDISWTKWDSIQRLRVRYSSIQPDTIVTLKWKNVFRYSLGSTYQVWDCLKLRAGVMYDQGPTPNEQLRSPRVPDTNRFWTAIGCGYQWNCFNFDFAYAHLFVRDFKIDKDDAIAAGEENFFNGRLRGKYDANVNIVAAQVVYNF